jgi:hypothetical protein
VPEPDIEARLRLAQALASGATMSAAARAAGYQRKHAYRLLEDPGFQQMLESARERVGGAGGPSKAEQRAELAALYLARVVAGKEDDDAAPVRMAKIVAAKALVAAGATTKRAPASQATPAAQPQAAPAKPTLADVNYFSPSATTTSPHRA